MNLNNISKYVYFKHVKTFKTVCALYMFYFLTMLHDLIFLFEIFAFYATMDFKNIIYI